MSRQIINDGETGLLTRNKLNENFEETFLLNTVNVNKLAHLPGASGGFIQLGDDELTLHFYQL